MGSLSSKAFVEREPNDSKITNFYHRNEGLERTVNFTNPDIIAAEIVEEFQAVVAHFSEIASDWKSRRFGSSAACLYIPRSAM